MKRRSETYLTLPLLSALLKGHNPSPFIPHDLMISDLVCLDLRREKKTQENLILVNKTKLNDKAK